ncbi:MAG: hypothetical protein Q9228_005854 [Teloschistes exilis]
MSMMAAAAPFAGHPVAMAGMAHGGHPMAPGHPSNQGMPGGGQQPGATMGQQMHGAVSGSMGPGVPQGQPGPMMGGMMPAGGPGAASGNGGPSMHALSHLTPGHPSQIFAQQQQQQQLQHAYHAWQESDYTMANDSTSLVANNPALAQQQSLQFQRQFRQMQFQHAQQQQQMAQNGGMALGHGNNPLNPAQFRPSQGNPNVRPPVNILQQQHQAQLNREQQQQQQQQQQHQQQQQQHHAQQQQQHQAMAHHMALQQATQGGGNPPQPTPQPQSRPPSQMAGGPDPQAAANVQQHSQMQQQHSQQQQQPPPQQSQTIQQPQPQSQQQPQPQAQAQQQTPQQAQSQQQPTPQSQAQQQHQAQQQAEAQVHHVQQNTNALMGPRVQPMKGASVLKLMQFADLLGDFSVSTSISTPAAGHPCADQDQTIKQENHLSHWQGFVGRFFSHTGVIRQHLYSSSDQATKTFEISPTPTLARYYWTHFNSGVQNIQMILGKARELDLPNGGHAIASDKTSFVYWLADGHQLVMSGRLRVQFDRVDMIDLLEILTTSHEEFVPRAKLLRTATESPEMKQSPNQSKTTGKKGAQQRQKPAQAMQDLGPFAAIPRSTITDHGVTPSVQKFLEVAEAMSLMQPLFKYSQSQLGLSPKDALRQMNQSQYNPQQMGQPGFNPAMFQQQQNMNPNLQFPPGQRTPNFVSPANSAHLTLPNQSNAAPSPATIHGMSPAMTNMNLLQQHQAPTSVGMVHSVSQHGTNNSVGTGSQGPSASASPNNNKRQRPSAIKGEDEGGGMEINGVAGPSSKVKPSPRISKRQKGNG